MADAEIIARTGWTTAELLDNLESQKPQGPYDLVSLLIGVNNQFRGQTEDRFRKELVLCLIIPFSWQGVIRPGFSW
jgi:hypothetical protein